MVLRANSNEQHQKLESSPALSRLLSPALTLQDYAETQQRFYGAFKPLENQLDADLCRLVGIKKRGDALGHDLVALGVDITSVPLLQPKYLTDAEALGCLYVLEGSRLGSVVIKRALMRHPWFCPDSNGRFLDETESAGWREVTGFLDASLSESQSQQLAVQGARYTFNAIAKWMTVND